ncbi:MAG: sulfatase-like hydrolase/transferase [Gammaproteobacteria bacterium]|nr:sulfatase-like hydrolase/transferase [Gammaproteobacteria bacterium]
MSARPNFLFITTDQQRADHLGCYGNAIVNTPAIDEIASRAMQFNNFFVACPICMPNRVAILTGRMPTTNGTRHNGIPLDLDAVTFVDQLRESAYRTGLVGKAHFQNITGHTLNQRDIFPKQPDRSNHSTDAYHTAKTGPEYEAELMPLWRENPNRQSPTTPYYGYDFVRFANGHADHVQGHYTGWLAQRHDNAESLRGKQNALPATHITAPQAWRTAMPEELYPTSYIAETSKEFISDHVDNHGDSPFFLHCSFTDPHHPFTPPGRYFDMYDPDSMPLSPSFHHVDHNEPELLSRLRSELAEGRAKSSGPYPFCVTEEHARQITALTYGMVSMIDDAVAGLMEHLKHLNLLDNTVVIFTSDHGDFMGDHGLMLKHGLHYDGVLRVPFIWADPHHQKPQRTDLHGSSVDIGACVLARAGLAPNNGNQGIDIVSAASGDKNALVPRTGILIEEDELGAHLATEQGLRTRSFIADNWRLTLWEGMEGGELFDRSTDPYELNNLWNNPTFAEKRATMTEAMLRETIRLTDTSPYATYVA